MKPELRIALVYVVGLLCLVNLSLGIWCAVDNPSCTKGPTGNQGEMGNAGPPGPVGWTPNCGYIYNHLEPIEITTGFNPESASTSEREYFVEHQDDLIHCHMNIRFATSSLPPGGGWLELHDGSSHPYPPTQDVVTTVSVSGVPGENYGYPAKLFSGSGRIVVWAPANSNITFSLDFFYRL